MLSDTDTYLETLRAAIQDLSLLDRMLVALHFGAGLSHQEIGRELALPTATIDHRLQRSISVLRLVLTETGFQHELDSTRIHDAISSGISAPRGLLDKVHRRISTARVSMQFSCGISLRSAFQVLKKITFFWSF